MTAATDAVLRITTSAPFYYQFAAVFAQNGLVSAGCHRLLCVTPWQGDHAATFSVQSGVTYYVQAGAGYAQSGDIGVSLEEPGAAVERQLG